MNICVYGAASDSIGAIYKNAGEQLGEEMARRGHALIFGGQRYTLEDIFAGHWPQGLLSESGLIVRNRLLSSKGVSQPEIKPEDMPKETFGDAPADGGDAGDDAGDDANEDKPEE